MQFKMCTFQVQADMFVNIIQNMLSQMDHVQMLLQYATQEWNFFLI